MLSKNKITILLFILAAGISAWLYFNAGDSTIRKDLYDFAVKDTAAITRIYMVNTQGAQVTLERTNSANWMVNEKYKARPDAIKNLLVCISDLAVRQPVAKSGIENVAKSLASSSTKVEIYQGKKLVKVYYVGSDTQDGLGTFMLLADEKTGKNSPTPFIMFIPGFNGFLSIRYFLEEDLWRDRTIFSFFPDEISSIHIEYVRFPDSSFTVSLSEKNEISILNHKGANIGAFDTVKAKRYLIYYKDLQYEALSNHLRKTFLDSLKQKGPVHVVRIKDRKGNTHVMKTFARPGNPDLLNPVTGKPYEEDPERMFALINDDKDWALIQFYVFGKLFQSVNYFSIPSAVVKN